MRLIVKVAPVFALSALLAACQTGVPVDGPGAGPVVAPAPAGVEGNWVDPNGMISSFSGGTFQTRAPDTNEKLAEGTYRSVSPNLVQLEMRSIVRGTVSNVNCSLYSANQLNCTSSAGSQFSLSRKVM